jgi:hypothetical protein
MDVLLPKNPLRQFDMSSLTSKPELMAIPIEEVESNAQHGRCRLLELPLELRQQIYTWVYLATPIYQAHLALYPAPMYSAYFLKAVIPGFSLPHIAKGPVQMDVIADGNPSLQATAADRVVSSQHLPRLLPAQRPMSCVPSPLLRTCQQIYEEARGMAFASNEFVFVNWFSSGLSVAHAVNVNLQGWQRSSIRWVRLEMQCEDFKSDQQLAKWIDLCGYWAQSLRGLRLKVAVTERSFPHTLNADAVAQCAHGGTDGLPDARMVENMRFWVREGLRKLGALEQLEVELADKRMSYEERLGWCGDLKALLNGERSSPSHVTVICVERRI